jgi:hypothetical protein
MASTAFLRHTFLPRRKGKKGSRCRGVLSIDPTKLPRDPFAACAPVYPWNFIRTNTIYGVIHAAGGRTAWADKHAVYAAVSGPTGTAMPSNVDDYYAPDVNSDVIPLPGVHTATGLDCDAIPDPNGGAWTDSLVNIRCYDQAQGQRRGELDSRKNAPGWEPRACPQHPGNELSGRERRAEAD